MKLLIMQFSPAFFDPNIMLSTPLSNIFSLHYFLDVTDKDPHPNKYDKITVLYKSIRSFLTTYRNTEDSEPNSGKIHSIKSFNGWNSLWSR